MLNREEPFGIVIGMPGISLEQGGRYYRNDGTEVDENGTVLATQPIALPPVSVRQPVAATPETMTTPALKVMVEQFGGTWTNRAAALAFLADPR